MLLFVQITKPFENWFGIYFNQCINCAFEMESTKMAIWIEWIVIWILWNVLGVDEVD